MHSKFTYLLLLFFTTLSPLIISQPSHAGVLDIDAYGLSIHLTPGYNQAPLGLDSEGTYVFNPGLGIGYDFRENAMTSGFSPVVKAGVFKDCNFVSLYYATAGVRYAYIFADDYSIGASLNLGLMNGEDWFYKKRSFSFMPLPIFEIGRRIYKNDVLRLGAVYAPNNNAMSATSGGGLIFLMLSYGHSF